VRAWAGTKSSGKIAKPPSFIAIRGYCLGEFKSRGLGRFQGFGVIFTTMAVKLFPGSTMNWCTVLAGI